MKFFGDEMVSGLLPAETSSFPSPVPTQIVSSDEYLPLPQTAQQREVEARLKEMSDRLAKRQGISRRRFFETAAGMAAVARDLCGSFCGLAIRAAVVRVRRRLAITRRMRAFLIFRTHSPSPSSFTPNGH